MYTFSSKLKTLAFVLMVVGALGIGYSFFTAPKSAEEVEAIINAEHAHGGHGEAAHEEAHDAVEVHAVHDEHAAHAEAAHEGHDTAAVAETEATADTVTAVAEVATEHASTTGHEESHAEAAVAHEGHDADAHAEHEAHKEHVEHVYHQLQNKPWAAVYVAALFFMLIALGALAFYAIQNAAQAGWSPVLFRVMEGISAYLIPGAIIVLILLVLGVAQVHHLFIWMDPEVVAKDHLIQGKTGFLNGPFFLFRAVVFMGGWILYRQIAVKNSLAQDNATDNSFYKKNFKASAAFLVFFIVTESISSWDWIMSVDPHWYSTLFGWYVFASFFVSGITVIAMVTLYLKSRGYLEYVNTSHIHDLAKFMFGISVFWTYLWFSQFMLMWYADIPEEVVYFKMRIENYNLPFFGMVAMNFVFPVLILVNTDFKRLSWIVVMAGIVILTGHYIDFFNMIMPATVGDQWFIGAGEIGAVLFFLGLFILVIFSALTKAPLLAKRNPLIEESKHFHY
ncbi:quinol:cytochrome C oxidoreductase [Flavobacterium psychrotrophum]|uniref:quinol:cytochrome C oxidoreductase n=1 Tax=Flavobacterium psychrotrophum TaxID=2294119 RepID=UPI000E312D42|nr:quinol:cytochrome C oxidoreductase [Flavobacterium psychrotrophum]